MTVLVKRSGRSRPLPPVGIATTSRVCTAILNVTCDLRVTLRASVTGVEVGLQRFSLTRAPDALHSLSLRSPSRPCHYCLQSPRPRSESYCSLCCSLPTSCTRTPHDHTGVPPLAYAVQRPLSQSGSHPTSSCALPYKAAFAAPPSFIATVIMYSPGMAISWTNFQSM